MLIALRLLGLGMRQDRNIAIDIFSEREEVSIRNVRNWPCLQKNA